MSRFYGWKVSHRIECRLSSERLNGNQVQKMQEKRILGTVGRSLLIAKKNIISVFAPLRETKREGFSQRIVE
jgi:spore coat polysaccharide biosynthesis protein SpsF (cytidylyltransferase family)